MTTIVRFIDFIHQLRIQGRVKEADYYFYTIPPKVQVKEGIAPEELLMKPIDEALWLIRKPPEPVGCENAWGSYMMRN